MAKELTLKNIISAIRIFWIRVWLIIRSVDVLLLVVGLCALTIGVLVDVLILRLLCLLVVIATGIFLYLTMPLRHRIDQKVPGFINSLLQPQSKNRKMKKLVFDDFQSMSGKEYKVKEVHEQESEPQLSPASEVPLSTPAPHGFVILKPEAKPVTREFQITDFFDVDSDIFKGDTEPRTEFDFLLNKVLVLIKEVVFANSVVFFWANREKHQMVIEERITDSGNFISSRRFPMGNDLVSKVAETGKPELITEVNPLSEGELLRYYDTPAGVKSFAGVPVFFSKLLSEPSPTQPVAVIAIDSTVEGTFGPETLSLLGQFTKLVSALIKSYTDKYDLLVDSELLASMRRVRERLRTELSLTTIQQAFAEEVSKFVNWDFMSIVLYDEKRNSWIAKKVVNRAYEGYIAPEQAVDFPHSVAGQTVKNNIHYAIEDLERITLPRFYGEEKIQSKGSLLSLPISSLNKCYGALVLESRTKRSFSKQDTETLSRLAEYIASSVEIVYMNDVIKEYVIIDEVTGAYARKFFIQRIEEELQRADDSGSELSLLLLTVDHSNELIQRFGQDGFDRVMGALAKAIRLSVRKYDLVGRLDYNRFGVMLTNTAANEAYLWAEKIRKNVAAHVITLDDKSFSITISVGVCGALEGMKKEELIANTVTVLHKASESGGNAVRVF